MGLSSSRAGSHTCSFSEGASCFIEGDRRLNDGIDDRCLQMGQENKKERERGKGPERREKAMD